MSDDEFGPALPPHLLAARTSSLSKNTEEEEEKEDKKKLLGSVNEARVNDDKTKKKRRRVMTVAPPPPNDKTSESEDEEVGPVAPPPSDEFKAQVEHVEHLERLLQIEKRAAGITTSSSKSAEAADVDPTASARAEWMLVPPDINNAPAGVEMKSRTFSKTTKPVSIDRSGWTDTPQEKAKRAAASQGGSSSNHRKRAKEDDNIYSSGMDDQTKRIVEEYNAAHRPQSLMDSHLASYLSEMKYEKDSDDVSKRRFDRDRDIASHRIKADDKKKMVEAAKNLDSGFKRSYL